jgi:hypothetical protein
MKIKKKINSSALSNLSKSRRLTSKSKSWLESTFRSNYNPNAWLWSESDSFSWSKLDTWSNSWAWSVSWSDSWSLF